MISAVLGFICLRQQTVTPADLIRQIAQSGRCVTLAETPDEKVRRALKIAPGLPPMLSFRYYEGKTHHRFGNNGLMLDDAGH